MLYFDLRQSFKNLITWQDVIPLYQDGDVEVIGQKITFLNMVCVKLVSLV